MSCSLATPDHTAGLHGILSQIAEIDAQVGALSQQVDTLKDRRSHLEKLAVEEMQKQRLDRVGVAGRSWRVEYDHHCSVAEARKKAVMEAARKAGVAEETLITINAAKLKSVLKEIGKSSGKASSEIYSVGTPFEGLVGEYVAPRLRHVTVS